MHEGMNAQALTQSQKKVKNKMNVRVHKYRDEVMDEKTYTYLNMCIRENIRRIQSLLRSPNYTAAKERKAWQNTYSYINTLSYVKVLRHKCLSTIIEYLYRQAKLPNAVIENLI